MIVHHVYGMMMVFERPGRTVSPDSGEPGVSIWEESGSVPFLQRPTTAYKRICSSIVSMRLSSGLCNQLHHDPSGGCGGHDHRR
jgi:hypothetical protein